MRGPVPLTSEKIQTPDQNTSKKGQRRSSIKEEVTDKDINLELDYLHERINQMVTESYDTDGTILADLDTGETLANTIIRLNLITQILRDAGLIRTQR